MARRTVSSFESSWVFLFSFCVFPILIEAKASFAFMYFWAFNNISVIDFEGLFASATMNSLDFNLALKVVSCTLSSTSSNSSASLLNRFTYDLSDSPSSCLIVSRWSADLFWHCPPTKCHTNELLSCSKSSMGDWASLLNHIRATPLRIV